MGNLHQHGQHEYHTFKKGDEYSQVDAQSLLQRLGLDHLSRTTLESRWNLQWSNSWATDDSLNFESEYYTNSTPAPDLS